MKGQETIELKGEKVKVLFTVGAREDLREFINSEDEDLSMEDALNLEKYQRQFLHYMSKYAGNEVPAEDFKYLPYSELVKAIGLVTQALEDVGDIEKKLPENMKKKK